jgi:hypothetical protein
MWRLLSKPLELFGLLRIGGFFPGRGVRFGHPSALDAQGGQFWKNYLTCERLYDVWGPRPEGPWLPFHCIPLFAALDSLKKDQIGPPPPPEITPDALPAAEASLPSHARPGAPPPEWLATDTLTFVDLPGPAAVVAGAWLVTAGACQPVCTFNNWPHTKGVLRAEETLAELLRWATTIAEARPRLSEESPPVWICDSGRLGGQKGKPGEFDNRYFLDDTILPAPAFLRKQGISRVVYVSALPVSEVPIADLDGYFIELSKAGFPIFQVDVSDPQLQPSPWDVRPKPRAVSKGEFGRSAAGGFGTDVPHPSSGGGG